MPKSNVRTVENTKKIYLDYASATPVDLAVFKIMTQALKIFFANPSAINDFGVKVKNTIEDARGVVAKVINAHNNEIIFTSGSTESNNLAILGTIDQFQEKTFLPHIVTTNIEHASVLEACKYLEKTKRAEVTYVEVESNGIVDPKKIKEALKSNTVLVSVMYANNEIGTIQPIREIAKTIRHYCKQRDKHSKNLVLSRVLSSTQSPKWPVFHTDATQAINYLSINVEQLGIDLLSFNAAKIYGPKGIGALFRKKNTLLMPIIYGGNQEFGLRSGTENIVSILGFKKALVITEKLKIKESKRLTILRDYFIKKIKNLDEEIIINGDLVDRLPNNINITITNIPSDLLVIELSAKGIMASAKSACKSGDGKVSHVIQAINKNIKDTDGSLRFSLGRQITKADINHTVKSLSTILQKLEKWYN
jgi:cysteine desulfurase